MMPVARQVLISYLDASAICAYEKARIILFTEFNKVVCCLRKDGSPAYSV